MWTDLFPNEKIPPCIAWVDMYMQGKANATAKAFFYGLKLIETSPKELAKYPTVGEGENDPSNVWEACFQVNDPVDIDVKKDDILITFYDISLGKDFVVVNSADWKAMLDASDKKKQEEKDKANL